MKKTILILGGLALGAAVLLLPHAGKASIIGSKHDFSTETNYWIGGSDWVVSYGATNVCGECHTIHHAQNQANGPLFIHTPSANSYILYNEGPVVSPTFPSGLTLSLGPGSLACLSCHDGSVAINSTTEFSVTTNGNPSITGGTPVMIAASAIVSEGAQGNDLTHMHPIGVNYTLAASAALSQFGVAQLNGTANTFNSPGSPTIASVLKNGQVECSTCHDIHRTVGGSTTSGIYTIASGQALCLACHIK